LYSKISPKKNIRVFGAWCCDKNCDINLEKMGVLNIANSNFPAKPIVEGVYQCSA
jgi:hypothetical protein